MFRFVVLWLDTKFPGSKAVIDEALAVLKDEKVVIFAVLDALQKYTPDSVDSFLEMLKSALDAVTINPPMRAEAQAMAAQSDAT